MTQSIILNKSTPLIDELNKYVIVEPYPFVIDIKKSQGMYLATVDGEMIFDWAGYYGSKLIAHNHPRLYESDYLQHLSFAANNKLASPDFLSKECLEYYQVIHSLAPECMKNPKLEVYAVNSGAEAVENMMKYFINLHLEKQIRKKQVPGSRRFIYFDQAFHGRTVFALNVTRIQHDPMITKDFHGFIPGNVQVPFPSFDCDQSDESNKKSIQKSLDIIEEVLKQYGPEIVAIIVEPIQGAGGHRVASSLFFQQLSRLAHEYDVFLGFDEVQTAGGPVGTFFAVDQFDLPFPPDAIAVAKKMAVGAVYMLSPMTDKGILDSTWGGSLVDMVRFVQEMKIVKDEKLIEQVPDKSKHLVQRLKLLQNEYPHLISNIRGLGLYQGFSMPRSVKSFLIDQALEKEKLLLLGAGPETIRLRPNLNVTKSDIDLLADKIQVLLKEWS